MAQQPAVHLLTDPLSEVSRKERKMLLGVGILAVGIVKTGLVPTKITALGIEFDKADQNALLGVLAVIVLYFLAAFVIYASADILAWRRALHRQRLESAREFLKREDAPWNRDSFDEDEVRRLARMRFSGETLAEPVAWVRLLFEFALPTAFGLYAVIELLGAASAG